MTTYINALLKRYILTTRHIATRVSGDMMASLRAIQKLQRVGHKTRSNCSWPLGQKVFFFEGGNAQISCLKNPFIYSAFGSVANCKGWVKKVT